MRTLTITCTILCVLLAGTSRAQNADKAGHPTVRVEIQKLKKGERVTVRGQGDFDLNAAAIQKAIEAELETVQSWARTGVIAELVVQPKITAGQMNEVRLAIHKAGISQFRYFLDNDGQLYPPTPAGIQYQYVTPLNFPAASLQAMKQRKDKFVITFDNPEEIFINGFVHRSDKVKKKGIPFIREYASENNENKKKPDPDVLIELKPDVSCELYLFVWGNLMEAYHKATDLYTASLPMAKEAGVATLKEAEQQLNNAKASGDKEKMKAWQQLVNKARMQYPIHIAEFTVGK